MSRQANPAVIGGFVLGALALIVIGILVFTSGSWFREHIRLVTYFPGSVQGLNVGAQVQFQGVPIGQVTEIGLDYVAERDSFRIPVHYDVWPRSIHVLGDLGEVDSRELIQRLIETRGLRAQLESVSIVTGQYLVTLSLNPSLPERSYPPEPGGAVRVPAIAATRDRVQEMLENLQLDELVGTATETLEAVHGLATSEQTQSALTHLDQALTELNALIATLNQRIEPLSSSAERALGEVERLAASLRAELGPIAAGITDTAAAIESVATRLDTEIPPLAGSARHALERAAAAMGAIDSLAGENSATRYELDHLLSEAVRTARAIRSLADYLERHPEALLQGKR